MDLRAKVFEIQNLVNSNKIKEASLKCEKLIKILPNNSYIHNLYGLILQKKGQISKSISCFEKSLQHDPNNFSAMNNLGNSYKNSYNYKKAEDLYIKIIKENNKNIKVLNNYANLKKELNKYKEAKNLLLEAIKLEPNNLYILSNIAACCQAIGEKNEAKEYALKILSLDPKNFNNHRFLSVITNYQKEPKHLEAMKKLLEDENFENSSDSEKIDLYFALGKAFEDVNDIESSFKFLNKANKLKNKNTNFDISKTDYLFNNVINLFKNIDKNFVKKKQNLKRIIFICGMPRSGTTLVEQIIASHTKVNGAGEIHYLSNIINKIFLRDGKFDKQKIIEELADEKNIIFEKYLEFINFHDFKTDIITDKAPQNFIWIGFIKLFFPNSKIIHCSRNPKDNCLSIYKNYFTSETMSWAYNENSIAKYYIQYLRIMKFWDFKFDNSIFDANYERIVNSPEKEIRKMISFCDLDWDNECLNFYKNKKTPIQTVSVSQASKPIYKSSINSSKAYEPYLSEMFNILDIKN